MSQQSSRKQFKIRQRNQESLRRDEPTMPVVLKELSNEWHCGPSGSGKSRFVRSKYPLAFIKDTNEWWDGYDGEDVVIVENFEKSDHRMCRMLKSWGDHYTFPANMKGVGKCDIRPLKIVITSSNTPEEIWGENPDQLAQIIRRYKVITYGSDLSCETVPCSVVEIDPSVDTLIQ